jgi:hypothetical protein
MVLIQRTYDERPKYNFHIGASQGRRKALTVAQRYPNDYDGIAANVPIVNFYSLILLADVKTTLKIKALVGLGRFERPTRLLSFIEPFGKSEASASSFLSTAKQRAAVFFMLTGCRLFS